MLEGTGGGLAGGGGHRGRAPLGDHDTGRARHLRRPRRSRRGCAGPESGRARRPARPRRRAGRSGSAYGYGSTSATTPWWSGDPQRRSSSSGVGLRRSPDPVDPPAPSLRPPPPGADRRSTRARALATAHEPGAARLVADLPAHAAQLIAKSIGPIEVLGLARRLAFGQQLLGLGRCSLLLGHQRFEPEQVEQLLSTGRAPESGRLFPSAMISKRKANACGCVEVVGQRIQEGLTLLGQEWVRVAGRGIAEVVADPLERRAASS